MAIPSQKMKHLNIHHFIYLWALFIALDHVNCLSFNYSSFLSDARDASNLKFNGESNLAFGALQVTTEARGASIANLSGRVLYRTPFKLWSKKKAKIGSFNTTFILNITPQSDPPGEGLAFILTKDLSYIPYNSQGKWLGIVNESTNGSSNNGIVAIEFDTKKSYKEDLDDNHVGVDINTIYSINQISLKAIGVNISSDTEITGVIMYNGTSKELKVFVFYSNDTSGPNTKNPVISMNLDLSIYLPEVVYVGFSASTGTSTELNCVKSWSFSGIDVDSSKPKWVWIVVYLSCGIVATLGLLAIIGCVYWRFKKAREDKEGEASVCEIACGVSILALLAIVGCVCWRSKKAREDKEGESSMREIENSGIGPKKYKLKELKSATGNFNANNELGRGGFGIVYKGNLKGEVVAVKRIWNNDQQGRKNMIAEVTTIGRLHHKNVVKLTGWCYESNELLLVYEYMSNGSLDKLLFPQGKQKQNQIMVLTWERRVSIVSGVAQSLDYLHNECSSRVLHRDIKTSNIMLDSEFNACLGDFGLARMFKLSEKTHHTTIEIAGTRAYMAPELFHTGKATAESDVYAFGVLALEVISGRKPGINQTSTNDELSNSIVEWVWELYRLDMICNAVDQKLKADYNVDQAECVLLTGLACCHPNPNMRPTIRSALQVVMGEALPPVVPYEKPAFVWPASAPSFTRELDRSFSGGMLSSFGSFSGR